MMCDEHNVCEASVRHPEHAKEKSMALALETRFRMTKLVQKHPKGRFEVLDAEPPLVGSSFPGD